MKTLIITIAVMLGLASCSNVSSKNSQVVNIVSYTQIGNDTISDFENETVGKLPSGFTADATGLRTKILSLDMSLVENSQEQTSTGDIFLTNEDDVILTDEDINAITL